MTGLGSFPRCFVINYGVGNIMNDRNYRNYLGTTVINRNNDNLTTTQWS